MKLSRMLIFIFYVVKAYTKLHIIIIQMQDYLSSTGFCSSHIRKSR